jgi:hypothetical protein
VLFFYFVPNTTRDILYYTQYIHINFPVESLYLLKNSHHNPLGSFKDVGVHKDRQPEATFLYYVMITEMDINSIKQSRLPLSLCMLRSLKLLNGFLCIFLNR